MLAPLWPAVVVMAVLALVAMPCLLAAPVVVLQGRTATQALGHAYRLTVRHFWRNAPLWPCGRTGGR